MATPALSALTTMRVGGTPARLIEPKTTDDLIAVARAIWGSGEHWLLLGGGSNIIAGDDGFDGTVLRVATAGIERVESGADAVRLRVQAGEPWDAVVEHAVANGWAGIEALSGIPGSTGAAPVQNIGAYGQELSGSLVAIDFLDYDSGELDRLEASELDLGYRTSALKRGRAGIVLAVELDLVPSDGPDALGAPIAYPQLAGALSVDVGARVPLADVRRAVLGLRAAKGMLLDDADPDSVSAGSFFTNPIVREAFARSLPAEAPRWPMLASDTVAKVIPLEALGDEAFAGVLDASPDTGTLPESVDLAALPGRPAAEADQTMVKLSAAWLIEHAGIRRGFSLPGSRAAISSKHTLAIVNTGAASAGDVAELARYVRTRVRSDFGVELQPEPTLVGVFV